MWFGRLGNFHATYIFIFVDSNASVIGHPLGGTPGKYNFIWGLLGGLNDHFTLQVGKMREVWFLQALHPRETKDFVKEIGQFLVVLHQY